jgi:hypothetical protein
MGSKEYDNLTIVKKAEIMDFGLDVEPETQEIEIEISYTPFVPSDNECQYKGDKLLDLLEYGELDPEKYILLKNKTDITTNKTE